MNNDDAMAAGPPRRSLTSACVLWFMRCVARLPLPWVRALGWLLGQVLHTVAGRRRTIARTNWRLCFPHDSEARCRAAVRAHFVRFGQAWLDRGWLWEGRPDVVRRRLHLTGDVAALQGVQPVVVFAPHFVGMDAGWTALTAHLPRKFCGIYAPQLNPDMDRWMAQGRSRFGQPRVVAKHQGSKPLVAAVRAGEPLYLLPDMDHGLGDAIFAPFFGVPAATLTSLPRFAKLGRAVVVPVTSRLTSDGYEVRVWPAWEHYPSADLVADVAQMNHRLQAMIATMPEQYYWVHKRFKTRPPGEAPLY